MKQERLKAIDPVSVAKQLAEGNGETAQMAQGMLELLERQQSLCLALEQALQQSQRSLRAIDYSFIGILETDGSWRIMHANRASSSITGMEARELSSKSLVELASKDGVSKTNRHLAVLREQGIAQSEWSMARADGQLIVMTVGSVKTDENRYIHFIDDVTEQRQANKLVIEARIAAELADRAKSEFLANVSHEVRTPLNGIIGLSQLALASEPNRKDDYLRRIHRSGQTLLQIINDLLDYAKIEAGKLEFEQAGFSLEDILDDLAGQVGLKATEKNIEIAFILRHDVPEHLVGDKLRVGQCLSNLLSNAIKFTESGKVTLEVELEQKQGAVVRVRFTVTDTGIGISSEVQAKICKPFTQADTSTARRFGGTGLGLAIVQEMVAGMDGTMQIDSTVGEGSRFAITLPIRLELPPSGAASMKGHALVIASHQDTRNSAIEFLLREGWTTSIASEPDEYLFASNVAQSPPLDLLVVDTFVEKVEALPGLLPHTLPLLVITHTSFQTDVPADLQQRPLTELLPAPLTLSLIRTSLNRLEKLEGSTLQDDMVVAVPSEFSGAHILVAEDNEVNQVMILDLLERAGIRTTLAKTGREVIDQIHTLPEAPDAILMDIQMPEMDGLEATRRLRENGWSLPIIALSAGISQAERDLCHKAGASDFLAKPIDMDDLWGSLTRWIVPHDIAQAAKGAMLAAKTKGHNRGLKNIIEIFNRRHGNDAKNMAELLTEGKLDEIARMAHSIKGVADNLGAHGLDLISRKIEQAANAGDLKALYDLIMELESEFDRFKNTA